jgi:hypothetical protein
MKMGDEFKAWREWRKQQRDEFGINCPECMRLLPKASPSILDPGQKCKMHNFRAPRRALKGET